MARMYIVAKAAVIVLGVYAISIVLSLVRPTIKFLSGAPASGLLLLILALFTLLCMAIYFAFIRQKNVVCSIIPPAASIFKQVDLRELSQGLRLAAVFSGLMLLPGAIYSVTHLVHLPARLEAQLFSLFGSEMYSHNLPENGWYWITTAGYCLRTALTVYLILGAPQYIRWQINKATSQKTAITTQQEGK